MNETAEQLRRLHAIHQEIDRLRGELARGPRQVRGRRRRLEQQQTDIERSRDRLKQARKGADEKNLQLKTNESKLHELQIKLNQTTSTREFEAIKGQMDADKMANSVLEDEILESLDKIDSLETRIATAESEAAEAAARTDEFAGQVAEAEAPLREELSRLEGDLAQAEQIIPATIAPEYRRNVQAHGPDSLAPATDKACAHCRTTLTAQQAIDLRTGQFTFCRTCGRLLYPDEGQR